MYIGIDCGTQGTKAIVLDSVQKKVIGVGYAKHELITQSNGRREQQPNWWIEALQQALQIALKQAKNSPHFSPNLVKGIGISYADFQKNPRNQRLCFRTTTWTGNVR